MDKSRHKSWQILTSVGPGISLLSSNEGFFSSGLFSAEKLVSDSEWGILPARARILVKFIVKGAADPSGWIFSRWFGFRVSDERIKFRTPLSSSSCDLCIGQMRAVGAPVQFCCLAEQKIGSTAAAEHRFK